MSKDIIICWDFDETLGYFRPMEFTLKKKYSTANAQILLETRNKVT
ncbi:hypothetical protein [Candidatus Uabimicrobium sp. HlEnr_7]